MHEKWYLKTWIICIVFALWFFIIPLILGIILLVLKIQEETNNKKYVSQLYESYEQAQKMLTPEMSNVINIENKVIELKKNEKKLQESIANLNKESVKILEKQEADLKKVNNEISMKKSQIINMDDEILVQEFGLYKPMFDFSNSDGYKDKLKQIRDEQKDMIKRGNAASGNFEWNVNGSASQGKKWFPICKNFFFVLLIANVIP